MPENYPVDLYYLMDLSGSMVEDLKKFPTLGQQIGIPFQGALNVLSVIISPLHNLVTQSKYTTYTLGRKLCRGKSKSNNGAHDIEASV